RLGRRTLPPAGARRRPRRGARPGVRGGAAGARRRPGPGRQRDRGTRGREPVAGRAAPLRAPGAGLGRPRGHAVPAGRGCLRARPRRRRPRAAAARPVAGGRGAAVTFAHPAALWLALLAVPVLVLHVLRPRRDAVEVSSVYLWRGVEATVSAARPWQRLRPSLLLLLQLLVV